MSDVHQFSAHEIDSLAAVLDQVIPPSADGRLPGAGFVARGERFGVVIRMLPGLDLGLAGGLAACDDHARKRDAADYLALGDGDRLAVLNEVAAADAGFVPSLMFLAYTTYYVDDRVLTGLDLEPRPPHPQGFAMPSSDLSLLDPVRTRGRLWRDA